MNQLLSSGDQGADVEHLRQALAGALGADADAFAVLKQAGSSIDSDFDAAIRRWQAGIGVIADGIIGPRCQWSGQRAGQRGQRLPAVSGDQAGQYCALPAVCRGRAGRRRTG